jgi:diguanylate cyclase (GGDEF)-like protein
MILCGNYLTLTYIQKENLIKLSLTDSLSGISNRVKFEQELDKWYELSKRYKTPLTLIIFDIDNFKSINDLYGHLAGDGVIISITKLISKTIRKTDIFARWGGDEFVILLPNTSKDSALELAERLRKIISEIFVEKQGCLSCSFGVVSLEAYDTLNSFIKRADEKMYESKKFGKNTVTI